MSVGAGFGVVLRALREEAALTQEELAERAGLTRHAVSALERGTRTRPYPQTVRALAGALGAGDTGLTALLAAVPARGTRPAEVPQAAAPALGPETSWVVPATTLFGRDDDLDAVEGLLSEGHRLLTLTGPGGVGKTRLVTALAARVEDRYADGAVPVALAALTDGSDVLPAVVRRLALTSGDPRGAATVLAEHLQERELLLVLDNFEHLLSAAVDVAALVSACPGLTVVVTSRAALRVRDEVEYAVPPLGLPSAQASTERELAASAAGALLLDRARSATGAVVRDAGDAHALAELCHRLAGLPLALELASAHLRVLPARTLLDRLHEVTRAAGARDLPERQRTLRATLDWSYALLSADEQRLFRLLAVFRGGATLEAVEAVAQASGVPRADVVPLLGQLVDHSLVVVRPGPGGTVRYGFLEPVVEYARTLLHSEEHRVAATAHGRYFRALAQRAALGYERADQVEWLTRATADDANLLLAIDRSLDLPGEETTAGDITWAMWLYWWLRGQPATGQRAAERCLAAGLPPRLAGQVHLTGATMAYAAGDVEAAARHWAASLELGTATGDADVLSKANSGLGLAALARGELDRAKAQFETGLAFAEEAGEAGVWMRSLAHVWTGTVWLVQGELARAEAEIHRGLALARERGDRLSVYVALYNLAQAAIAVGDLGRARDLLDEGIDLSEETSDDSNLAYFLEALAVVEAGHQRHEEVARLLGAAAEIRSHVSNVYAYYLPDDSLRAAAESAARAALAEQYDAAFEAGRASRRTARG